MKTLFKEQQLARELRKKGLSYREIQQKVHVSKASLSLWLKDMPLTQQQSQRFKKMQHDAAMRGMARRHENCVERLLEIYLRAKKDVADLTKRELFLVGVAMYWSEGTKIHGKQSPRAFSISNMDPTFLRVWYRIIRLLGIRNESIKMALYLHESESHHAHHILSFWKQVFPQKGIRWMKTVYKTHIKKRKDLGYNPNVHQKGGRSNYCGVLRISTSRGADLVRYMEYAADCIFQNCPVV